ncbi:uncharacterized protein LOC119250702 [Talpa occidentalis]|uniref:uncharacterized protein LOC119250702 n=1 Tax=Talpa occidentalis TaxID=50954 RepID=UPI0023F87FA8|nr:uncharacterized protein LOC119250702 [Talpa occidentalis]
MDSDATKCRWKPGGPIEAPLAGSWGPSKVVLGRRASSCRGPGSDVVFGPQASRSTGPDLEAMLGFQSHPQDFAPRDLRLLVVLWYRDAVGPFGTKELGEDGGVRPLLVQTLPGKQHEPCAGQGRLAAGRESFVQPHPGVLDDAVQGAAAVGVERHHLPQQVPALLGEVVRLIVDDAQHPGPQLSEAGALEGQLPGDHVIEDHPRAPDVCRGATVFLLTDDLRRHKLWAATGGLEQLRPGELGVEPEVCQFYVSVPVQEQVLRLQVPVHHAPGMAVAECGKDLLEEAVHLHLPQVPAPAQKVVTTQIPTWTKGLIYAVKASLTK